MKTISGFEAKRLLENQLSAHSLGLHSALAQYRCEEAVAAWHETIRAVEEFINLPMFGIADDELRAWLYAIRLDDEFVENPDKTWSTVYRRLSPYFEPEIIIRFTQIMLSAGEIGRAFDARGINVRSGGISLDTIDGAIKYFQSRRRHLVSLLYAMPYSCSGASILKSYDALGVFLPKVEHSCIAITGFHQKLALIEILPDFTLEVDRYGAKASHNFETLDDYFLEPERASIQAMAEMRESQFATPSLEDIDPRKIFSAAEVRNAVKLIGAIYGAFGLKDSDFSAMSLLMIAFSRYCRDDYYIEIEKNRFRSILCAQSDLDPVNTEKMLVSQSGEYGKNTNSYQPFIDVGDKVVSNVNFLNRFLYAFKNVHLGSRRRFQIHAGFIFEDIVKRDLGRLGFTVTDIKRINRKEFDVVATRGNTIFNVQCKNNWIDLSKIETDRGLFIRYNRYLVNYYERALKKELSRENLLKDKLGLDKIVHCVVSRFPVMSVNPLIVNHNNIDRLCSIGRN